MATEAALRQIWGNERRNERIPPALERIRRRKRGLESNFRPASLMLILRGGGPRLPTAPPAPCSSSFLNRRATLGQKEVPGLIFTAGGQRWRQILTASLPDTVGRYQTPLEESGRPWASRIM